MQDAKLFRNNIIEQKEVGTLDWPGITEPQRHSDIDGNPYGFIRGYAEQNDRNEPSYAVLADQVEVLEDIPEVSDSYTYLARQIKDFSAQREVVRWFETGEFERKLNELGGHEFVNNWLPSVLESAKIRTSVREGVGTDVKKDTEKFIEEYERRKAGESFKVWKSKFSAIGEYISGNMYTVFGESGRGKSVLTLEDAIYAAMQGANVLAWTLEMGWYEV